MSFEEDRVVSPLNEYEVLQLILGECRVRLGRYRNNAEEDLRALQRGDLSEKERVATELLLGEKTILQVQYDISE